MLHNYCMPWVHGWLANTSPEVVTASMRRSHTQEQPKPKQIVVSFSARTKRFQCAQRRARVRAPNDSQNLSERTDSDSYIVTRELLHETAVQCACHLGGPWHLGDRTFPTALYRTWQKVT